MSPSIPKTQLHWIRPTKKRSPTLRRLSLERLATPPPTPRKSTRTRKPSAKASERMQFQCDTTLPTRWVHDMLKKFEDRRVAKLVISKNSFRHMVLEEIQDMGGDKLDNISFSSEARQFLQTVVEEMTELLFEQAGEEAAIENRNQLNVRDLKAAGITLNYSI